MHECEPTEFNAEWLNNHCILLLFLLAIIPRWSTYNVISDVSGNPQIDVDQVNPYFCENMKKFVNDNQFVCDNKSCLRPAFPWNGRWANQFWAVIRGIQIAERVGIRNIKLDNNWALFKEPFLYHKILIEPDPNPQRDNDNCLIYNTYFKQNGLPMLNLTLDEEIRLQFVRQLGDLVQDVPDDVLVLHIRAGDIWLSEMPEFHDYAQPPCMYYKDLLGMGNWSSVWLFAEDATNPCVDYVRKFDKVVWKQEYSIEQIIGAVVGAKHLAFGRGSLGVAFAAVANDLQTLITYNMSTSQFRAKKHYNCVPTKGYYEDVVKTFRATSAQRKRMKVELSCRDWEDIPYDPTIRTVFVHDEQI